MNKPKRLVKANKAKDWAYEYFASMPIDKKHDKPWKLRIWVFNYSINFDWQTVEWTDQAIAWINARCPDPKEASSSTSNDAKTKSVKGDR